MQHLYFEGTIPKQQPELKETKNGKALCVFTIALREGYGDYKRTDYLPCVAFGKTAENIAKFFKKHSVIQVTGTMQNNPFAKNEKGYDIPNWQLVVDKFYFPPKDKSTSTDDIGVVYAVEDEEPTYANDSGSTGFSVDDFEEVETGDLPF